MSAIVHLTLKFVAACKGYNYKHFPSFKWRHLRAEGYAENNAFDKIFAIDTGNTIL